MSPHIQSLLHDAADDNGRPVGVDLGAIRAAGRRTTWRNRAVMGGSALGAAAVVTSIAMMLSPTAGAPITPLGPSPSDAAPTASYAEGMATPLDIDGPLVAVADLFTANGYETSMEAGFASMAAPDGSEGDGAMVSGQSFAVMKAATVGAAIVAEFTDRSAVSDAGAVTDGEFADCAVDPLVGSLTGVVWSDCTLERSEGGTEMWYATGQDKTGQDAIGVTLVRADGTGVTASVTTANIGPKRDPLAALPADAAQLDALVVELAKTDPLFQYQFEGGEGDQGSGVSDPCAELTADPTQSPPAGGDTIVSGCGTAEGQAQVAYPLLEQLKAGGFEATISSYGEGDGDKASGAAFAESRIQLVDSAGRIGSALVASYDSVRAMTDADLAATACMASPITGEALEWHPADDPSAPCVPADQLSAGEIYLLHSADGTAQAGISVDANGVILVIALSTESMDGSDPLTALPLTDAQLRTAMTDLVAANGLGQPAGKRS